MLTPGGQLANLHFCKTGCCWLRQILWLTLPEHLEKVILWHATLTFPQVETFESIAEFCISISIVPPQRNPSHTICRWASLTRAERLQKRRGSENSGSTEGIEDLLLPGVIDPITMAPMQNPAMAPKGHVMGYATWKAVLAEFGCCPFTKQPLHKEQVVNLPDYHEICYKSAQELSM